jgi:signal transduction histidine kinase
MLDAFAKYFGTSGFMPHGHCFLWTPSLLWSYVVSDSVIAVSYYSIPVALWYFVKKRADIPFRWIFVLFGVFVMACGTTHIFSVWNIWEPNYWADAGVKVLTAAASVVTALLLWPLIPKALAIPSQERLTRVNQELQAEVNRRERVEAELREINLALRERTVQLETANKELESFSYSVSHDLRAPLRHIDAFAKLLRSESKSLTEDEKHRLDAITRSATQMGRLIDDLLDLSRTGRSEVRQQQVDLNEVVAETRKLCVSPDKNDAVDWRLGSLPVVMGDANLLRVAFTNLLANAVKFSRGRERPVIEVDARPGGGDEVIICVKDNGAGFDSRFQGKLFGVFQRLHRDDEFEGTGIGLATVRRIVEKHGGRIWAEGERDRGASFFLTLRRAPA